MKIQKEVKENMITINYNEDEFTKEFIYKQEMKYMLNRLQSMFIYNNLPESIPENELEAILFKYGTCFITEVDGSLYALRYTPVDNLDVYDNFTKVNVSNTALNLGQVFNVEDGVICDNDYMRAGVFPIMSKYAHLMTENTFTIRNSTILLRMVSMITASDNVTKQSADEYLNRVKKGDIGVIGESPFFAGIRVPNSNSGLQNYLHQFLELHQYLKGSFWNELGLNANFNLKMAPLGANETALNRDFLHPLVDNMKECREKFVAALNEKYGLNITVEFNSSWKLEENEAMNETDSELNEVTHNAPSQNKTGVNHVNSDDDLKCPPPDEPEPDNEADEPEPDNEPDEPEPDNEADEPEPDNEADEPEPDNEADEKGVSTDESIENENGTTNGTNTDNEGKEGNKEGKEKDISGSEPGSETGNTDDDEKKEENKK